MNKRQLHKFFDEVNARVFGGVLPKTKLTISFKPSDVFGQCFMHSKLGQNMSKQKIVINYNSMMRYDVFNIDEIKRTLIHEMVHLWIGVLAKRNFSRTMNLISEHDVKTFNSIGKIAFDLGLIKHGDLLA